VDSARPELAAPVGGQAAQRKTRIGDFKLWQVRRAAATDGRGRSPAFPGDLDKGVAVKVRPLQRHKQGTGLQLPGVGAHATEGDVGTAAATVNRACRLG